MTDDDTQTCRPVLEWILEADPADLEPGSPAGAHRGPHAAHIERCPSCARAAALVREGAEALDAWLAPTAPLDVDAVLARARPSLEDAGGRTRRPRHARPLRWAVPLAAAALVLWLAEPGARRPEPPASAADADAPDQTASLDLVVPPDRSAAVFRSATADITVVLFFTGDDS